MIRTNQNDTRRIYAWVERELRPLLRRLPVEVLRLIVETGAEELALLIRGAVKVELGGRHRR